MRSTFDRFRRLIPQAIALLVVGSLFMLSREPALSRRDADAMASRFRFTRLPIPELSSHSYKRERADLVRKVHPSLRHISSLVSFVGGAVALADLDGDGLPNDLVLVDPRIDRVIIGPAPGTGPRYEPFTMDPAPLSFEPTTTAPMGCLPGDFNEDGRTDLLVYYWGRSPIVFLRRADEASGSAALPPSRERFAARDLLGESQRWYTGAITQADLDGDGHHDLIAGNYFPDGARILDAAGEGPESMPHSLSRAYNGGRKHIFLWSGADEKPEPSVRYREVEGVLDGEVSRGWTFAIGTADLDGDLLPEIYFVNDWGPDRLLHNRSLPGRLRFARLDGHRTLTTPRSRVLGGDSFNGMGIDFGDLNGDGRPDLLVNNITAPFGLHESHFVFLSTGDVERMREGDAPYEDASERLGLSRSGWGWEVRAADFDNDGILEVIRASGFLKGTIDRWPEAQELAVANDGLIAIPGTWPRLEPGDAMSGEDHNPFLVRGGDGRYHDLAPRLGMAEPMCTRGIAVADIDGDGRLDYAVANQWERSFVFHNTAPETGSFLGLHLRLPVGRSGPRATSARPGHPRPLDAPSRPAIGAGATVHLPDGRVLAAQVDGGTGHSGKRSPDLHFGLGRVDASTRLEVDLRWRDPVGAIRTRTLVMTPGWHTVLLGDDREGEERGRP